MTAGVRHGSAFDPPFVDPCRGRTVTLEEMSSTLASVPRPPADVVPISRSDEAIVGGLRAGEAWAADALYERYAPQISRMLKRVLGHGSREEFEDALHEVFVEALRSIHRLRDSVALLGWLLQIASHTAFRTMRRRRARRWLHFFDPTELPDVWVEAPSHELRAACRSLYRVLGQMPASEQLVFSLRYLQGLELLEMASALEISLSTTKRRLARAEQRFFKLAAKDPVLSTHMPTEVRTP